MSLRKPLIRYLVQILLVNSEKSISVSTLHLVTTPGNITWLVEIVSVSAKHGSDGNRGWARRLAMMEMGTWL